jgi:hypothetical protein
VFISIIYVVIVAFSLQLIDYCDALFIFIIAFKLLSLLIKFVANSQFYPLFWKNSDFDDFLSLTTFTHIPGQIFFNFIHYRNYSWKKAKNCGNAIVSTCILWYRENTWPREEDAKTLSNCILDLCEYDIHGIKLLSVKSYIFHLIMEVYMCV